MTIASSYAGGRSATIIRSADFGHVQRSGGSVRRALVLLAGCSNTGSGEATRQTFNVKAEPGPRAGQLTVPPGRLPTKGPIGLDPSKSDGVQLDVLSGLLNDTPIFNGDFADPFALRTPDELYIYASNTESTQYSPRRARAGDLARPRFRVHGPVPG